MFKIEIRSLESMLDDYKAELVAAFKGRGLLSIAIYGPGYLKKAGDRVETWLVFKDLDVADLTTLKDIWKRYSSYNFSTPFVTKLDEITGMDDSFPLEAIEGLYGYKVIWGKDIFKDIRINPKEHRAQIELELRSRLINLRKVWVQAEICEPELLMGMLYRVYEEVLFCSRCAIILKDRSTNYENRSLFEHVSAHYKVPKKVMDKVMLLQSTLEESPTVPIKKAESLYNGALEYISFLLKKVDEMEKEICK